MPSIPLWKDYSGDHWLRNYGKTQVIIIDDQWFAEEHFDIPARNLRSIENKMNISFHFFAPPQRGGQWNDEWFFRELAKAKSECLAPCMVLLDLMYGKETSPIEGSGKRFLKHLSADELFGSVPVMVITAGAEEQALLKELKSCGGSFQNFLRKHDDVEPFAERLERGLLEYALLSDPTIHAYSPQMRKVAQEMRKILLDPRLKEKVSINSEEIATSIPIAVLFVGDSGDGKNYLAKSLQKMSDRRNTPFQTLTCSDITDPEGFEKIISGCGPYTGYSGKLTRINSKTGERDNKGDIELAIVGMITNVNKGTLLLDELGNSVRSLQSNLFRVLDSRQIKPLFVSSEYIPADQPYDVWMIVTMQPRHTDFLEDLGRRLHKMVRIDIPPLRDRHEDVIPLASTTLDRTRRPEELFTDSGIEWLKENYSALSAGKLTAILSKVSLMSSIGYVNRQELEKAATGWERTPLVQSAAYNASSQDVEFKEYMLPSMIREHNRRIVDYLIEALERSKNKRTGRHSNPQTWWLMTNLKNQDLEGKKIENTELQRLIGEYIFQLNDEEIIQRMEKSEVFKKAVLQCGKKNVRGLSRERFLRIEKISSGEE